MKPSGDWAIPLSSSSYRRILERRLEILASVVCCPVVKVTEEDPMGGPTFQFFLRLCFGIVGGVLYQNKARGSRGLGRCCKLSSIREVHTYVCGSMYRYIRARFGGR